MSAHWVRDWPCWGPCVFPARADVSFVLLAKSARAAVSRAPSGKTAPSILENAFHAWNAKRFTATRPDARAVVLTGYGNIATAVTAVKLGAIDYLAKPADADDVVKALLAPDEDKPEPPENPMSADRVRWEHIQRVYELCDRNVSETARRLNMHRRTLQRILAKRAPR